MIKPTEPRRVRARLLSTLLATTAVATLASPVLAQQTDNTSYPLSPIEVLGQRDAGYRANATLTATKTPTVLIDTPQAVSVVTRDQIDDQGLISMNDLVRYVPGASYAQGEGNRDTLVLRGIANTADFFTDGVRDDTQYYRDFYNIERVEILNGPNAMTFGRGGPGGVVNRVTRQAGWTPGGQVRVEAGSDSFYRGAGDYDHVVNDQLAVRLTGVYENSDSYRNGVEFEKFGINPTASIRLDGATLVQLGYEHFEDRRVTSRSGVHRGCEKDRRGPRRLRGQASPPMRRAAFAQNDGNITSAVGILRVGRLSVRVHGVCSRHGI